MNRRALSFWLLILGLACLLLLAVVACVSNQPPQAPFTYTIDPTVEPVEDSLPGIDGVSPPRAVAAVADAGRQVSSFVADELFLMTDDATLLNDVLTQYNGEILVETDPADFGMPDLATMYLLRVDPSRGDLTDFVTDMGQLGGAGGTATFSSDNAARLAAMAAAVAAEGHPVAMNWVGSGHAIPDNTEEAPSGPSGYDPDAYQWDQLRRGTVIDIGVPEAWSLLHHAGALDNRVPIAILDGGFSVTDDFGTVIGQTMWPHLDVFDTENPGSCGAFDCPWHGTSVASIALAQPDNAFGTAGTGGPVGDAIFILTTADFGTAARAVLAARDAGARIINMSFSADVNWFFAPLVEPFNLITRRLREDGILLFAAAGNDGTSVDQIVSLGNWERTWVTPCENDGVICVGGLADPSSEDRHANSNFGSPGGSVDIYAPYCNYAGPDPDHTANEAQWSCGTSGATPYVAGVAALIWAADPDLSADEVWNLMASTARDNGGSVNRVNAYDAVLQALEVGLAAEIEAPSDGSVHDLNRAIGFMGRVTIFAAPGGDVDVDVRWSSDRDGVFHQSTLTIPTTTTDGENSRLSTPTIDDLTTGDHTITFRAATGSLVREVSIDLTVGNSPPTNVEILQPASGTEVCEGESVTFRGTAFDINQQLGLPESAYSWRSSVDGFLATGSNYTTSSLDPATHLITLRATDSGGLYAEDSIALTVKSPSHPDCDDLSPTAIITSPADGASFWVTASDATGAYEMVTLRGTATDPEDVDATLMVEWFSDVETPQLLGTGTEITVRLHMIDDPCSELHTITLRVTDSSGNVTEDTIEITINNVC